MRSKKYLSVLGICVSCVVLNSNAQTPDEPIDTAQVVVINEARKSNTNGMRELVLLVLQNHPELSQAEAESRMAVSRVKEASAGKYPQLSFSSSYGQEQQKLYLSNRSNTFTDQAQAQLPKAVAPVEAWLAYQAEIAHHVDGLQRRLEQQVAELSAKGMKEEDVFFAVAIDDLSRACDLFAGVHARTGGVDGWCSLEVSPLLAYDATSTVEQAVRMRSLVMSWFRCWSSFMLTRSSVSSIRSVSASNRPNRASACGSGGGGGSSGGSSSSNGRP
jgi:hypothetical protein